MLVLASACAAASLLSFPDRAGASPASIREAFAGNRGEIGHATTLPPVARYLIDEGGVFVLDRSSPQPLLKFEDSLEIWVLSSARGPRGDVIFKNDIGETMLRATKLGGMTVFTQHRPDGSAAALAGASTPLHLPTISPAAFIQRFFQCSLRVSRTAEHLVSFETVQDANPATDGLIADAAGVAVEAMLAIAGRPDGKAILSRIDKIQFATTARPGAVLAGGVLTISVAPGQGVAGRPSSRRIQRAVGGR